MFAFFHIFLLLYRTGSSKFIFDDILSKTLFDSGLIVKSESKKSKTDLRFI